MRRYDWGMPQKVVAHCMDLKHGLGVHFKLKAQFEEEAEGKVHEILMKHHANFLRTSGGDFVVKFEASGS